MSIQNVAKQCGFKLYPNQIERAKVVEWLLAFESPSPKERGRTTLLALGYINEAIRRPGEKVYFSDHLTVPRRSPADRYGQRIVADVLRGMVAQMDNKKLSVRDDYVVCGP